MTRVFINEVEEKTSLGNVKTIKNYAVFEVKHYDGRYKLSVRHESFDGTFTSFTMFAEGNFGCTIANGRKSQKKLDNLNNLCDELKNDLYDLWTNKKYNELCQLFYDKANERKFI